MTEPKSGLAPSFYRLVSKSNGRLRSGTAVYDMLRPYNATMNKKRTTNAPKGQVLADVKEA